MLVVVTRLVAIGMFLLFGTAICIFGFSGFAVKWLPLVLSLIALSFCCFGFLVARWRLLTLDLRVSLFVYVVFAVITLVYGVIIVHFGLASRVADIVVCCAVAC